MAMGHRRAGAILRSPGAMAGGKSSALGGHRLGNDCSASTTQLALVGHQGLSRGDASAGLDSIVGARLSAG